MTWNQPVCPNCWNRDHPNNDPTPNRSDGDLEHCCLCGDPTRSGIYVRLDPATVPFPKQD